MSIKISSFNNSKIWNEYWNTNKKPTRQLYDIIAQFYRIFIIKKTLNKIIKKYFNKGSNVLHAGCGSGQVDMDIKNYLNITALDFSENALRLYKEYNGEKSNICLADIFNLPYNVNYFDGIYNLGVMEHFSKEEIKKILFEFNRILKPSGKIILFWPPEFGLSVLFFKFLSFITNTLFRKNIKFHPDEISRIKSLKHAKIIIRENNFKFIKSYFGLRDLFTYVIIVAEK